jgi:hypothetical protein
MALDLDELMERAREYVRIEARADVMNVEYHETLTLLGKEDVVLTVTTDDEEEPRWWVIGGSTPMNLYSQNRYRSADEAYSLHQGLMLRLLDKQFAQSGETPDGIGYDAFVCHASEDKESLVRPLAEALTDRGFDIWFDEFEMTVGDSLRRSIDRGLANSRFGIVVLSQAFFDKNWPQYELDGLTALEMQGRKVILPVWHEITNQDVLNYSPPLADKLAVSTAGKGLSEVVDALALVLEYEPGNL